MRSTSAMSLGIIAMVRSLGALTGTIDKAEILARSYEERLQSVAFRANGKPRPRVYFEEWDESLISGMVGCLN